MNNYTITLVTTIVVCVVCLIIEETLQEQLQSISGHYIKELQEKNDSFTKTFFLLISDGAEYIVMGTGFIFYVPTQSIIGSLCVIITFTSIWLGSVLKMLYAHPRPFWVYSDISGMSCADDFGAPSGHALVVGAIVIYFYVINFRKFQFINTTVAALLLGLIGIDRNYLGVHFHFQVVLGYAIAGLVVCVFMSKSVWKWIEHSKDRTHVVYVFELCIFLASLLAVWIYSVRNPYFDSDWSRNFSIQCNDTLNIDTVMFKSLLESTVIWIVGGFTLGIHLLRRNSKTSWKYYVASYTLLIVIVIIEMIIEIFSGSLSYASQYFIVSLGRFVTAFSISFLSPYILSLCFPKIVDSNE